LIFGSVATISIGVATPAATFSENFSTMAEDLLRLEQQLYGTDVDNNSVRWLYKNAVDVHEVWVTSMYHMGKQKLSHVTNF
jgi:hypothetical protein